MPTFYCPNCWQIISEDQQICPQCGFALYEFNRSGYEDKLIAALRHSVQERRIMAAQILGDRESLRALPEFLEIVTSAEMDYFFLRAVLWATLKFNHPDRLLILRQATNHPSDLVARLAKNLLDHLDNK